MPRYAVSSNINSPESDGNMWILRIRSCARFLLMLVVILQTTEMSAQQTNGEFRRGDCHVDGMWTLRMWCSWSTTCSVV